MIPRVGLEDHASFGCCRRRTLTVVVMLSTIASSHAAATVAVTTAATAAENLISFQELTAAAAAAEERHRRRSSAAAATETLAASGLSLPAVSTPSGGWTERFLTPSSSSSFVDAGISVVAFAGAVAAGTSSSNDGQQLVQGNVLETTSSLASFYHRFVTTLLLMVEMLK